MSKAHFPRVLLISSSVFNQYSGGGITLSNLFKGWPREKIAMVHSDSFEPSQDICSDYLKLGAEEFGWIWPINRFVSGGHQMHAYLKEKENSSNSLVAKRSLLRRLPRFVTSMISHEGLQDRAVLSWRLKQKLDEFRPELIYSILGSRGFTRLCKQIKEYSGAKLVIHMMDDWPATRYRTGIFGPYFSRLADRELKGLLRDTDEAMAISGKMAEVYSGRYKRPFSVFCNALDIQGQAKAVRKSWKADKPPYRLLYAGSIIENAQLMSLVELARGVEALNAEGIECNMVLKTATRDRVRVSAYFDEFQFTVFENPLENHNFIHELAKSDVLLLPVNFDKESALYVRYSNPTKLAAYLLSGTPILAYGPERVDQISRAHEEGWGLAVRRQNQVNLQEKLIEILTNNELRAHLGRQAQKTARQQYDISKVRREFQTHLKQS